ncbi:hypothetical protein [Psychrobacillus sp. NPDC096623]|uniref:hypothetical protein n=1 Tax=Psychrobacillus sp. NPDC096623 TaxID=3364492 RepID=UPI003816EF93
MARKSNRLRITSEPFFLSFFYFFPNRAIEALNIRTREKITIAKIPIKLVIGSNPAKKVSAKGTFNNANPAIILANIKNKNRSIQLSLLSLHYMKSKRKVEPIEALKGMLVFTLGNLDQSDEFEK